MRVAAGGCGSDGSGFAGEGGPMMSRSRLRIGFAVLTCSPDTDHSEEPMRPGRFAARCSLALSLLVAMALGFASSAGSADPVPNPAVSGPIDGGVHGYPWNHSVFAPLEHPGDRFSYDIFSQAIRALRDPAGNETTDPSASPVDPMRGMAVRWIVANGASQSASFLTTFVNGGYNRGQIDLYVITRGGGPYQDFSTPIFQL